jgi:hypothetical protein
MGERRGNAVTPCASSNNRHGALFSITFFGKINVPLQKGAN